MSPGVRVNQKDQKGASTLSNFGLRLKCSVLGDVHFQGSLNNQVLHKYGERTSANAVIQHRAPTAPQTVH